MKSFNEYQQLAGVTRKMDEAPLEFAHYALGLVGEAGELASPVRLSPEEYVKELGDCFWYAAGVLSVSGVVMEDALGSYPNTYNLFNLTSVLSCLLSSAAAICELGKKYAFYGKQPSQEEVVRYVREYVLCLLFLCRVGGYDPLDVCAKNIAKLEARFGGKFDAFRAINRDVVAEAKAVSEVGK